MFHFFGLTDLSRLAGFAVLCLPAAVAVDVLAIVRLRRDGRQGTTVVAGAFLGFVPYGRRTRQATVMVKKTDGQTARETFLFPEKDRGPADRQPAAFLLHNGLCCAFHAADAQGELKSATRRIAQVWIRCALAPFAGYFFATLLMVAQAMGGGAGDSALLRLWEWGWVFFILAGYAMILYSLLSLRASLRKQLPELQQAYAALLPPAQNKREFPVE